MEHEVCACDGEEGALVEGCEAVGDAAHGVLADAIVDVAAVVGSGLAAGCAEVRLDKLAILSLVVHGFVCTYRLEIDLVLKGNVDRGGQVCSADQDGLHRLSKGVGYDTS